MGTFRVSATSPNRLLAALPRQVYQRMLPHLEVVPLAAEQVLCEKGETIRHVYFPGSGLVGDLVPLEDARTAEAGTIGNEGLVGLSLFLGSKVSGHRTICHIAGEAQRMTTAAFQNEADKPGPLHALLLQYTNAVLFQRSQSVACTGRHTVLQRCSRWLLMAHDRLSTDQFALTQARLAQMLCVRRLSVSAGQATLQRAGLIRYGRGVITLLDRKGLEGRSCECYQRYKEAFDLLLG